MIQPLLIPTAAEKRIDTDFYVEGYATTFDKPYLLYEWDGNKYYERIDRNALAGADMSDVIMQYNHEGKVLARLSNGTLGVEANDNGLFTFADLSKSRAAQDMFEEIKNGLVTKMSWAFRVSEDSYDRDTRTRTILKIAKVYDVSAVSIPANADNAASADTFGFDCVCLIKGILWGWRGDTAKSYGGASYAVNGVPDIGADQMITKCAGVSTDFSNVAVGEALWCEGHIGVYIGNGLGVECTPRWDNKVQITAVANIGKKAGYNARTWRKHGKLPYIDYTGAQTDTSGGTAEGKKDNAVAGYAVGDIVEFIGTKHYTSANASSGKPCKAGKAKITQIYKSGKHQYHLVKVSGGGSTVYGWVDAQDISGGTSAQKIMAGSKVRVKAGAKTYSGGSLASFVYSRDHIVKELSGKRAVITYGGTVVAAVNVDDLTLV